jgi:hypothetical protein
MSLRTVIMQRTSLFPRFEVSVLVAVVYYHRALDILMLLARAMALLVVLVVLLITLLLSVLFLLAASLLLFFSVDLENRLKAFGNLGVMFSELVGNGTWHSRLL